jgi:ribosomal protein S18 acetylase RimI-like enzyme
MKKDYTIRDLRFEDGPDLINAYFSYYKELESGNAELGLVLFKKKPGYESEVSWFAETYKGVLRGDRIAKVAEVGGKAVGLCEISKSRPGSETDHIGALGIAIMDGYRDMGIGTALISAALADGRARFEAVKLTVFTTNKRAITVYKKMGFVELCTIPKAIKRGSRYFDEFLMYLDFGKIKRLR